MRKIVLAMLSLLLIQSVLLRAQSEKERYKIYGTIIEKRNNEPLKKFPFEVMPYKREVKTDNNGKFILNLPRTKVVLIFDYYPFDKREIEIDLAKDTVLTVLLTSPFTNRYLEEVEIIANRPVNDKPVSIERLDKKFFLTLPAMLGERDLVKTLSLTSGVSSSSEASADMQVRGGTHGQNLYLMNDVPLYFTQHALGFTSAYNPTIVQSAELYKAGFPARYGGKISSILAVKTIEPTLTNTDGEIEIGLLSSKAMINFPIKRDKAGAYIAGRISNFSPFLGLVNTFTAKNETKIGISFMDINAGITYKAGTKDNLNVSFFRIGDNWNIRQKDRNNLTTLLKEHSQINASLQWLHRPDEITTNSLLVYADRYISSQVNQVESTLKNQSIKIHQQGFGFQINTLNITEHFTRKINPTFSFSLGATLETNMIRPVSFWVADSTTNNQQTNPLTYFHQGSLYAQSYLYLTDKQKFSLEARASVMGNQKLFFSVEPRIAYQVQLPQSYSISASVSRMSQPIHRIANSGLGFPMEVFIGSHSALPPEGSWTLSLGGGKEITSNSYRMSLKTDAWYKQMSNIVEFYDGMDAYNMLMKGYDVYAPDQQVATSGNGKAYGVDCSLSLNHKNTTIFVDYTLMRAVNQFEKLNMGKPFSASTDIRNSLSLTATQKLSPTILLSASWQFNSGRPLTVPVYVLPNPNIDLTNNDFSLSTNSYDSPYVFLYGERNNYRTRAFHKLDVSLTKNFLVRRKHQSSFTIGLYNAYNQQNPFVYSLSNKKIGDNTYIPVLNSISIFPIIPSFSFRMKF